MENIITIQARSYYATEYKGICSHVGGQTCITSSINCCLCTTLHHIISQKTVIFRRNKVCFVFTLLNFGSLDNILNTLHILLAGRSGVKLHHRKVTLHLLKMSSPPLGLTQPPTTRIKGSLYCGRGMCDHSMKLGAHHDLVLRLKASKLYLQSLYTPSWFGKG